MELKTDTILQGGKYRIIKKLGQGSFGITYLALAKYTTTGALGKMGVEAKVAIKEFFMREINSRLEDGSTVDGSNGSVFINYRKKFKKEAENLLKLEHPGIVKVQDVFDENGTTYYSMEYVDGGNLDEYISKNNPIDETEAITFIRSVCNALSYMHEKKMLHLDLKPKNIMRSSKGDIYLIDFGLSKQFTENGEPESSTTIGQGTPGYAPIEQAKFIKDGTFPATLDIYALGATIYKVLTGNRPLDASEILNDGFSKDLLLHHGRSETLIRIVEKSMSPMKKDRFQNVSEIIGLLPKDEFRKQIKKEDIEKIDADQNKGTIIVRQKEKRKKKTTQSKVDHIRSVDDSNSVRKFVNFPTPPSSITIHLLGKDNNWCRLWITCQFIKGEGDRHFKSVGIKKIKESEFYDIVTKLDSIIHQHRILKSDPISSNINIWCESNATSDNFYLDYNSLAEFCRILPYNKQFRLHRFINKRAIYNNVINKAEYTTQSRFQAFLNKFSENGSMWHDLKLSLGLSIGAVAIMLTLIFGLPDKESRKDASAPNKSAYQQDYQSYSNEIDSLTILSIKTAIEELEMQSK